MLALKYLITERNHLSRIIMNFIECDYAILSLGFVSHKHILEKYVQERNTYRNAISHCNRYLERHSIFFERLKCVAFPKYIKRYVDCWYGNTQRTQTSLVRHQQSFSVRHSFPAAGPCHARYFLSRVRQTDRLESTLVRIR